MFRYVHTNIIANNVGKLMDFYNTVFHCKSINETRRSRKADGRADYRCAETKCKEKKHIGGYDIGL